MHVGTGSFFQNLGQPHSDAEVYRHELALADAPSRSASTRSGRPSTTSPTTSCPERRRSSCPGWPAGRARCKLGTMVTVLPWHDPVRVAENFTLLDHLSRRPGHARPRPGPRAGSSSTASGLEMGESRRRFTEYTEAILDGAGDRATSSTTASCTSSRRSDIRPEPLRVVPEPDVRLGHLAGVDGPHGPARRRADGHRPEAVGQRSRRSWPPTATASASSTASEAPKPILCVFAGVSHDRGRGRARCPRRVPPALRPLDASTHYEFDQRRLRRHRGLRVLRRAGQEHREARHREVQRLPRRPPGVGDARRGHRAAARLRAAHRRRRAVVAARLRRHAPRRGPGQPATSSPSRSCRS